MAKDQVRNGQRVWPRRVQLGTGMRLNSSFLLRVALSCSSTLRR